MIQQRLHPRTAARLTGLLAAPLLATGTVLAQEAPGEEMAVVPVAAEAGAWLQQVEELALANDELGRQNALLRDRVGDLRQQLEAGERAGRALRTREQRRWFITGAAVLLAGLLLGLLLSRLRLRQRSRWGDL